MATAPIQDGLPPDGLIVFAKRDCPTCELVQPVLRALSREAEALVVFTQDDPSFPEDVAGVVDDTALEQSFRHDVDIVPTLIRREGGREVGRTFGWDRAEWEKLTGLQGLGNDLPAAQPGCGSKSRDPGVHEHLRAEFGETGIAARRIEIGGWDDPIEACFERGWSDGLPVVPPTDARILRMLAGTRRKPDEVVGRVPPNLVPCTVEKVAINAVMAGCKPEYLPVVLAAVEAALDPGFGLHGLLATTGFAGPIVIVNGPVTRRIGMNWGMNALGQGNRANATIGRALQLIVRNVGGGRPGEIDRACLGNPGKYTFCFAEDETDAGWTSLAASRGVPTGKSAVTLFPGEGVQAFIDQKSRQPEELCRSMATGLWAIVHPKLNGVPAVLVLSPEHYGIFRDAGWDRAKIEAGLAAALQRPGDEVVAGAGGVPEGLSASVAGTMVAKFPDGSPIIVRAGGPAGLFSGILAGWSGARSREQCHPVTKEVSE